MYLRVKFLFVLTPSPCGHSPYILLRKTQGGERVRCISPFLLGSDVIQNDPSCCGVRQGERVRCISLLSLLRCYSKRLAMLRGMVGGRGLKSTFNILNSSIAVPRSITGCGVSYIGEVSQSDGRVNSTEMAGNIREIPARRRAQILQSPYTLPLHR